MTTVRGEKIKLFVKIYVDTSDMMQAARAISKSKDKHNLQKLGKAYLNMPEVQDAIEEANTFVLDREGIARSLTEILISDEASRDQKIKAANALEKLTRGDSDEQSGFQDDFERFLHEYGDVLESFLNGKTEEFEKVFRPRLDDDGKVRFHIKKNKGRSARERHLIRQNQAIILLRTLISRNAFLSSS